MRAYWSCSCMRSNTEVRFVIGGQLLEAIGNSICFLIHRFHSPLDWFLNVCCYRGSVLDKAWAYYFHVHRAAHRTNYTQIGVIRAINRYCVHPTLRLLKFLFATVSMNGRQDARPWCEVVCDVMLLLVCVHLIVID